MSDDIYEDVFPQARPPRHTTGCPACGAPVTPTKSREVWPQHVTHGQPRGGEKCGLSGHQLGYETDMYFRTFFDRDNPTGFPQAGHEVSARLEDFGNAVGLVNMLAIPNSFGIGPLMAAEVTCRVTKADFPRFMAELNAIAARHGWLDEQEPTT